MDWQYFVKRAIPGGLEKKRGGVSLSDPPSEMRRFLVAKSLLKDGGAAIDVGAHLGKYTRHLSEIVGEKGKVWSFEPNPYLFKFLQKVARKAGNVVALQKAISNHTSTERFFLLPRSLDDHATLEEENRQEAQQEIFVDTLPLDELRLQGIGGVKLIRVDVKGHERAVFEGAEQLTARSRPYWLFEQTTNHAPLLESLHQSGYHSLDLETLEPPLASSEESIDLLAYPKESEERARALIDTLKCF